MRIGLLRMKFTATLPNRKNKTNHEPTNRKMGSMKEFNNSEIDYLPFLREGMTKPA